VEVPTLPSRRGCIEEEIESDQQAAYAWWNSYWYEIDPELGSDTTVPSEIFTVPDGGPDPTKAQVLESLYEWRGQWWMVDAPFMLLCVALRWQFSLKIGEEKLHGPWEKTRRIPATVRNIPARAPSDGARSLRPRNTDGTRKHDPAGSGSVKIEHECHNWCDCWKDYEPFVHWRPWNNPPEAELRSWEEKFMPVYSTPPMLSDYLQKLLWDHRQTEPQKPGEVYRDWRSVSYFILPHLGATVDRVYMYPQDVLNVPKIGPRIQQDRRYVKVWWQFFRKGAETKKPPKGALSDVICSPSGKAPKRIGIDVEYTIVKRDPCEEVPHYKTHDSAEEVMEYLGCSRATAFREIKKGFRIPRPYKLTTAAELLPLIVAGGGGYMKLTPGPVYTGSGWYSEGNPGHPDLPTAQLLRHRRAQAITTRRSEIPIDHYQVWLDRKGWLV